jgi:hypothetical protein
MQVGVAFVAQQGSKLEEKVSGSSAVLTQDFAAFRVQSSRAKSEESRVWTAVLPCHLR